jgi:hypothetical protein
MVFKVAEPTRTQDVACFNFEVSNGHNKYIKRFLYVKFSLVVKSKSGSSFQSQIFGNVEYFLVS